MNQLYSTKKFKKYLKIKYKINKKVTSVTKEKDDQSSWTRNPGMPGGSSDQQVRWPGWTSLKRKKKFFFGKEHFLHFSPP